MFGIKFQIIRIWQRHFVDQVTVLSVLISMFSAMILCGGLIASSYKKIDSWKTSSQGTLVLPGKIDDVQRKNVEKILAKEDLIERFIFQNRQDYFNEFSKKYSSDNSKMRIGAGLNLFPSRYKLELSDSSQISFSDGVEAIESKISGVFNEPIRLVYGGKWAKKSQDFSRKIQWLGYLLIGLFALLSSYISSVFSQNFISSFIDEIKIKTMIGARPKHTVGPIFLNTILLISFSFLTASLVSFGILEIVTNGAEQRGLSFFKSLDASEFLSLCSMLAIVIGALSCLGLFSSWMKMKSKLDGL